MIREQEIVIIGGGLVGSLLSLLLQQRGFDVLVVERRQDPRLTFKPEGRSINLALSHRGIRALKLAGVFDQLKDQLIPMSGRMMHDLDSDLTYQPYGMEGEAINSVSRSGLNHSLIQAAEDVGVTFLFGSPCEHIDLENKMLTLGGPAQPSVVSSQVIIGADGAFSQLRREFESRSMSTSLIDPVDHGYKELTIPSVDGDYALEPNALHIWPRGHFMLIALPNPDKSFTCTLFLPISGDDSFETISDENQLGVFFRKHFPDAIPLIPNLSNEFFAREASKMVTLRTFPWAWKDFLLIGDAAHAIVPFYGQGMNAGFEDCTLLIEMIERHNLNWGEIFQAFQSSRKEDAEAIADLAMDNFITMRDRVSDPNFLKKREFEQALQERYPETWIPLYSMVSFSDVPYARARQLGQLQEKLLDQFELKVENYERIINRFNDLRLADQPIHQ